MRTAFLALIFLTFAICNASATEQPTVFDTAAMGAMGTARAQGFISTILVSRDILMPLLSENMTIVPLQGLPSNLHPVTFFIGQHSGLKAVFPGGFELPIASTYHEITFGIPNIAIKGQTGTFTYIPILRLDSLTAIVMGWLYGFPKKYAHFEWIGNDLRIYGREADYVYFSYKHPSSYDKEAFAKNVAFLDQNNRPLVVKLLGQYRCIDFNWNFKLEKMQPASASLTLTPNFSGGASGAFDSESLDKSPLGTVYVDTQWKMSAPHDCN